MVDTPSSSEKKDMLQSIFEMQPDLNDYVFRNNDLRASDGSRLNMKAISQAARDGQLSVNDLPNQWLVRYATAMEQELGELKEDLLWKWWSKDEIDLQNIRVELVLK